MNSANGNGVSGNTPFDEGMCERYILGELSEPEQELFENAYFNDDAFFNRFLAVKDELLDLYSRDELDPDKQQRVERHFGSTRPRRDRLAESDDFVRSITAIADRDSRSKPLIAKIEPKQATFFERLKGLFSVPALAVVAVLLVLVAAGFWIVNRPEAPELIADEPAPPTPANAAPSNPQVVAGDIATDNNTNADDNPRAQPSPQSNRPQEPETAVNPSVRPETSAPVPSRSIDPTVVLPAPVPTPEQRVAEVVKPPETKPEVTGTRTETVTLSSASRSVTGRNTASIGTATQSVVIRMLFGGDAYESYSVRVTTLGGATVWRASNLTIGSSAKSLAVTVPASSLTRKDYIVILEGRSNGGGSETIREYYLHVDRK
ncbi:MAG TPA: hypothetical protein VFZ23_14730 [Pyrinomonadaceae bacterium]